MMSPDAAALLAQWRASLSPETRSFLLWVQAASNPERPRTLDPVEWAEFNAAMAARPLEKKT